MHAIMSWRIEIVDGPDKGYVLEEQNRVVNLSRVKTSYGEPYTFAAQFMTPDCWREKNGDFSDLLRDCGGEDPEGSDSTCAWPKNDAEGED